MIASFGDPATEDLYHGRQTARARRFPREIVDAALVKMDSLNGAASVLDLRAPPGNRLESLKGALKGLHSIRGNDQWRLIFRWEGSDAHDVRLADYH
jgi:proteic killer suppression protein